MKDSDDIRAVLKRLFGTQKLAVLATLAAPAAGGAGQPHLSLMAFAATTDLEHLVFATERGTRKYANLSANPRVALLVDDRSNQDSDVQNALAVTATGKTEEVVLEAEREPLLRLYLARHPDLAGFVRSPACALLRMTVESYRLVSRFQEVRELRPSPRVPPESPMDP